MRLSLRSFSTPIATIGYIRFEKPFGEHHGLWTVERPWLDNTPHKSCVPGGFYALRKYSSTKYPDTWALEGESVSVQAHADAQRSLCLFHIANWWDDVEGCVGPGLRAVEMLNQTTGRIEPAVQASGSAMDILRELLSDEPDSHSITIHRDFELPRWTPKLA